MRIARRCTRAGAWLLLLGALASGTPATAQDEVSLAGKVVDEAGAPVAGAIVSGIWRWTAEGLRSERPLVTAADGSFTLKRAWSGSPVEVLVLDDKGARGGFALWKDDTLDLPATVTLVPAVSLRMKLLMPESLPATYVQMFLVHKTGAAYTGAYVLANPGAGALDVALPPGEYALSFNGPDLEPVGEGVTLTAGKPTDLGDFQLQASVLSQYAGKTPPELNVTDARGVPSGVKLADYKGKWVLLEFWGFW